MTITKKYDIRVCFVKSSFFFRTFNNFYYGETNILQGGTIMGIYRKDAREIYDHYPEFLVAFARVLKDDSADEDLKRKGRALFASLQHMGLDVSEYLS